LTTVSSPSASLASRDILFSALSNGQNPAERGRLRSFFRTKDPARKPHFGLFSVSLRPLSLTQPNHAHFSTDVIRSRCQRLTGGPERTEFEGRPLRQSEPGSNNSVRYGPSSKANL
jgi:hypothetical protein